MGNWLSGWIASGVSIKLVTEGLPIPIRATLGVIYRVASIVRYRQRAGVDAQIWFVRVRYPWMRTSNVLCAAEGGAEKLLFSAVK